MNSTLSYLARLKSVYGDASDYKAAQLLDISCQSVSKWRNGRTKMGDATAVKLAELLEIPPVMVVADLHIESAKTEQEKAFWEGLKSQH